MQSQQQPKECGKFPKQQRKEGLAPRFQHQPEDSPTCDACHCLRVCVRALVRASVHAYDRRQGSAHAFSQGLPRPCSGWLGPYHIQRAVRAGAPHKRNGSHAFFEPPFRSNAAAEPPSPGRRFTGVPPAMTALQSCGARTGQVSMLSAYRCVQCRCRGSCRDKHYLRALRAAESKAVLW